MKMEQRYWTESEVWKTEGVSALNGGEAQWVLILGGTEKMCEAAWLQDTKQRYPKALITGCSTAGEICAHDAITGCELHNQTMTITTFSEH